MFARLGGSPDGTDILADRAANRRQTGSLPTPGRDSDSRQMHGIRSVGLRAEIGPGPGEILQDSCN